MLFLLLLFKIKKNTVFTKSGIGWNKIINKILIRVLKKSQVIFLLSSGKRFSKKLRPSLNINVVRPRFLREPLSCDDPGFRGSLNFKTNRGHIPLGQPVDHLDFFQTHITKLRLHNTYWEQLWNIVPLLLELLISFP